MLKHKILALTILILLFLFHTDDRVSAQNLFTNGGFETGNFTGWTAINAPTPFENWRVTGSGACYCDSPVPTATSVQEGSFNAHQPVASAPGSYLLYQDIAVPAASNLQLRWMHKYQMNLSTYCAGGACGTATFAVEILNTSNVLLQTLYTVTTSGSSNTNTGWVNSGANISAYAGQTIRVRFRTTVTANYAGPGRLEVDNVRTLAPTAANVSIGGRITDNGKTSIPRAMVTLTDSNGNSRTVISNLFGHYKFDEVQAGETYVLVANHGKYTFADNPRVISVEDNLSNVDFQTSP